MDKAGSNCVVYDVVFNPEVLAMGIRDARFREKVEETALDAVEKSFKVKLDRNNVKKPKLQ
jgi:dynein assembly factor 2